MDLLSLLIGIGAFCLVMIIPAPGWILTERQRAGREALARYEGTKR